MSKIGYLGLDVNGNDHPALSQPDYDQFEYCPLCKAAMEWEDCDQCEDGAYDAYDDDPINESPGTYRPCEYCEGKGGFYVCPNAGPNHGRPADAGGAR